MATQVLYEGYLTKSPPEHKINRAVSLVLLFFYIYKLNEIIKRFYSLSSTLVIVISLVVERLIFS